MRPNRGAAIGRFLDDLAAGDPVALGFVAVIAVMAIGLGLFIWKVRRNLNREDESRAKRSRRFQNGVRVPFLLGT